MRHTPGLKGEMTSQDAQVVCHETVAAIPATGVTLDRINTSDPHEPEGQLPKQRLVLLIDVTALRCLWAEKAYPHMQHVAFPSWVFSLGCMHQADHSQLGALHAGDAKPLHFPIGLKRAVGTGTVA